MMPFNLVSLVVNLSVFVFKAPDTERRGVLKEKRKA